MASGTMHALTYDQPSGKLSCSCHPMPEPRNRGEVIIRVRRAGICSTDMEICSGYVPGFSGVLGHEFVGTVHDVGTSGRSDLLGKRVW